MYLKLIIISLMSYFIGCFCGAYYYGIIFKNIDIRNYGSGNLGALNSGRVLGTMSFVVVLFIDSFKGIFVVMIGRYFNLGDTALLLPIFAVIIGHIFPMQLKFKGGKGIAVFLGALAGYNYLYLIIIVVAFIPIYIIMRNFTISGLVSIAILPVVTLIVGYSSTALESFALMSFATIIIIKHKVNILRYMKEKRNNREK